MKIYTRTGDDGTTGLFAGGRVKKNDPRVEAYGTVDELNCLVGLARAVSEDLELDAILAGIQDDLFVVGADLATPVTSGADVARAQRLEDGRIGALEVLIDRLEADLPPLRAFILPGGGLVGAQLHLARTVCRRAERRTVALVEAGIETRAVVLRYLNRLSDLLFVIARWANHRQDAGEVEWHPERSDS